MAFYNKHRHSKPYSLYIAPRKHQIGLPNGPTDEQTDEQTDRRIDRDGPTDRQNDKRTGRRKDTRSYREWARCLDGKRIASLLLMRQPIRGLRFPPWTNHSRARRSDVGGIENLPLRAGAKLWKQPPSKSTSSFMVWTKHAPKSFQSIKKNIATAKKSVATKQDYCPYPYL